MISKDYYWSNCLLESIKLKLRNWNDIKIRCVSVTTNFKKYHVLCPHFYAESISKKIRYDFHTNKKLKFPQWLFWKGHIIQTKEKEHRSEQK